MPKESFINKLIQRRIPQILGSYLVAATSLVLFIEYLVEKYQFPTHFPTLALFGIIGILPSVVILAYFHGAPGKDNWTKVEKIGIPVNILFIGACLLFGNYFSLWEINSNQNRHVFYIGSLEELKKTVEHFSSIRDLTEKNGDIELLLLKQNELNEISLNIESKLLNEFYNQDLIIEIVSEEKDQQIMGKMISDKINQTNIPLELYKYFNEPDQIGIIFGYKININDNTKYLARGLGMVGSQSNNWSSELSIVDSKGEFIEKITELLKAKIRAVENRQVSGIVTKIDENIIIINPNGLKLIKNMKINGNTNYLLNDKDENGFTDKDEDLKKLLDDIKNASEYIKNHPAEYTMGDLKGMQRMYNQYSDDKLGLRSSGMTIGSFNYTLKVVDVTESTVVTKLIKLGDPWVKIRVGDKITIE